MVAIVIVAVIFILLLFIKVKTKRQRASLLIGFGVSILSFFAWVLILFSLQRTVLMSLLGILYASITVFLIFWNVKRAKWVYFILCIPVMCIATGIAVIQYQYYVHQIPVVNEYEPEIYFYEPFRKDNRLAKLDGDSWLKITGNLPVLDGATALCPVYGSFVQTVYPEGNYDFLTGPVLCSRTDMAYENLLNGEADIIFCAGPSEMQKQQFRDHRMPIKMIAIGREGFVFFVNSENPIENITVKEIQGIYSGQITNWKTLNGINKRIRVFQRPNNSGSQTMLEKIMGDISIKKARRENVSTGMGGIINKVAVYRNFPDAIGYSFLHFSTKMVSNNEIKLLSVDGVYPSAGTIRDGSYPLTESFYAIYIDTPEKNENIETFVDWMLSDQGQELIKKTGYVPVTPK